MKMIQSFNTAIQSLMVRLFTQMPTRNNRQRGASALEYIVLVAVIVAVIVGVMTVAFPDGTFDAVFQPIVDALS
ncbi:hypothetical protein [Alloalcanivorax xenomutans]|uniref:hypothetical protein n=1 Tax=Alloalcanivorax xenomutans TaxID=1094342 RepID=UPI003BAD8CB0